MSATLWIENELQSNTESFNENSFAQVSNDKNKLNGAKLKETKSSRIELSAPAKNNKDLMSSVEQTVQSTQSIPPLSELEQIFQNSDDLYSLGLELLEKSENGDPEAQYYLAKVIITCDLSSGEQHLSAYDSGEAFEIREWLYTRCAGFNSQNIVTFGHYKDWLKLSAQSGFALSQLVDLALSRDVTRDHETLLILKNAIDSRHHDAMSMLSSLSKNDAAKSVWALLACDYGYDCSDESKESWRMIEVTDCALKLHLGEECNAKVDYVEVVKRQFPEEKFLKILERKSQLKKVIESGDLDELTFDDILN
ncbi:hypothetical protein [Aliikangiella coralliicola]|uniref:hypothetical protein n=1 Tax=Aliikangiella coralliicola TaxID=2592383 RepID=UPI00143CE370|nr:hypothetical protein [Aliikangiella coralliicola]